MPTAPSIDSAVSPQRTNDAADAGDMDAFDGTESALDVLDQIDLVSDEQPDDTELQNVDQASGAAEVDAETEEVELLESQPQKETATDQLEAPQAITEQATTEHVATEPSPKRQPPAVDDLDELLGISSNASDETTMESPVHIGSSGDADLSQHPDAETITRAKSVRQDKTIVDIRVQGFLAGRVAIYWALGVCYFVGFLFISQYLTYPDIPLSRHLTHFLGDAIHWGPILVLLTPLVIYDLLKASQRVVLPVVEVQEQLTNMLEGREVHPVTTSEDGCIRELVAAFEELRKSGAVDYLASAARRREADRMLDSMGENSSQSQLDDAVIA